MEQRDLRAQEACGLDREVNGAAGVDGPEDGCMTRGDRGPPVEVLTPDVDEVGVTGERGGES